MNQAFLGVEGGGSKARAALECGGRVRALTHWNGINPGDISGATFLRRLRRLLHPLLSDAGRRPVALRACVAVAGFGSPSVRARLAPGVRRLLGEYGVCLELELLSDLDALAECCLAARDGVVLIAGTGCACLAARRAGGRAASARVGGRGGVLDRGSGYWIGFQVLRHAIEVREGRARPAGALAVVSRRLGVPPDRAAEILLPPRRARIAGLVPDVLEAWAGGDRFARALVERAVLHLVGDVATARRRSGLGRDFDLHLAGGLFASPVVAGLFQRRLEEVLPGAVIRRVDDPLPGVLQLAHARRRPLWPDASSGAGR
jgi:N-acetylglucosamine kinase-like BadF-type ATPase